MEPILLGHLVAGIGLALSFGGLTFFSAVMAPLVFIKLPAGTAGGFIRQAFTWYYLAMGSASLVALVGLLINRSFAFGWETLLTVLVFPGLVFARQVLLPQINRSRDADLAGEAGAAERFSRLHRASVVINAAQWLAVLAVLIVVLL